jgi:hypothetical protein
MGCTGGAAATSNDTPGHGAPATFFQDISVAGVVVARVTWTNLVSTVRREHFRTYCVIWDTAVSQHCALRQATWDVNCDSSGAAANQHATVSADAAASVDPATGVQANNAANRSTQGAVGGATTNFTKP